MSRHIRSIVISVLAAVLFCIVAANVPRADELYEAESKRVVRFDPAAFSHLPLEGGGRRASEDASRVGVKRHHPTPAARNMLAADPPPQSTSDVSDVDQHIAETGNTRVRWEGAARVSLGSELINRILYEAQAIVTGQREPERLRAFPDCLEDVLVKVSGDPRLIGDPRLVPLKANAENLVVSFRYHDRMSGIPVHDEQGTRDRPYDLTVSFDAAKIDAALHSLGLEPWKEPRPRLALFVGVQNGPTPYVLSSDGDRGLEQRLSLTAAAYKRGMSIVLPAASMLAGADVRFDRLSKIDLERWAALAKDAGGDAALIGTLFWIEQEFGWRADWRLVSHGDHRWQIRGVNFDAAFRNAMAGSAQILSGRGEPK